MFVSAQINVVVVSKLDVLMSKQGKTVINVEVYRYSPEKDERPYMQSLTLPDKFRDRMVLDALEYLKQQDPTLAYRRSCREGVCGSDGMNINGKNWLA